MKRYVRSMVVNQGHISNKDCVKDGVILAASAAVFCTQLNVILLKYGEI